MTAETQRYNQYPITQLKCYRQQPDSPTQYHIPANQSVRPSTLLKLSEHIKSKQYSLNLLTRDSTKDNRTKRKIAPYPPSSSFRPSMLDIAKKSTLSPPTSPPILLKQPRDITSLSKPNRDTRPSMTSLSHSTKTSTLMKPQDAEQKVYYVSGLELLSWVSSKVQRLEVPSSVHSRSPAGPGHRRAVTSFRRQDSS